MPDSPAAPGTAAQSAGARPRPSTATPPPAGAPGGRPASALVLGSPGQLGLEQRPRPVPGPGELLIRPAAVGLCGTDLDIVAGRIDPAYVRYPLVLGHEWAGTVLAGGAGALAPGRRVVAEGIVPCGRCAQCRAGETNLCVTYDEMGFTRDGAAAGYAVVSEALVHPLADGVSLEDGALAEPGLGGLPGAGQRGARAGRAGPGGRGRHGGAAGGAAARPVVAGRDRGAGPASGSGGPGRRPRARPGSRPSRPRPGAATTWWWRRPGPPARCSPRWPRRAAAAPCCCSACRRTAPPPRCPWTTWSTTT